MKKLSKSLADTSQIARDFLSGLEKNTDNAKVVGLYGDLGAGKTAFTQCLAEILGIKEIITSTTFVIEKIYQLPSGEFSRLIHIDAYRLVSGKELQKIGWQEISSDSQNLILIEWPENVADVMPEDHVKIKFKFIDENTREIEIG